MTKMNRRKFIYSTAMIAAIPVVITSFSRETDIVLGEPSKSILLGVISAANNPEEDLKVVRDLGFPSCQLSIEDYSP